MSSIEPSSIRPATIVGITSATLLTGIVAYAFYFDYRRRTDAEFRKALKRDSRKSAKAAKAEAEASTRQRRQQIRELVDQVNNEDLPLDRDGHEQLFMELIAEGEKLSLDESKAMDAALYFYRALKVYPNPDELITLYDRTVAKHVLDILAEMIALDQTGFKKSSRFSAGSSFEGDLDV